MKGTDKFCMIVLGPNQRFFVSSGKTDRVNTLKMTFRHSHHKNGTLKSDRLNACFQFLEPKIGSLKTDGVNEPLELPPNTCCQLHQRHLDISLRDRVFNHITYGRGGGGVGPDHQIVDHNSKMALSSTFKLGDFFNLLDKFWQNFSKIDSPVGCCSCF